MTAADNLGQLTRLSARVEVLVADLANSAATAAEPDTAAAYLTALSGALAASGDRLTPLTLDKVQASLLTLYRSTGSRPSSTSGTVDPAAAALATALARYCAVSGPNGMSTVLEAGPLGSKAQGSQQERELAAMLLAAVAAAAAAPLEAAGLLKPAIEAAVKATRDPELVSLPAIEAVCWAVGGVGRQLCGDAKDPGLDCYVYLTSVGRHIHSLSVHRCWWQWRSNQHHTIV
jgi:hypothetical protein